MGPRRSCHAVSPRRRGSRLPLLPGPRPASRHGPRPSLSLQIRTGARDGEHLDGRLDVPLCPRRSEPRLRPLFAGGQRHQQRRHDDPPCRSCPPSPGVALHPPGSLRAQCPQHRVVQDRCRTLRGPQPGRRLDRGEPRHTHPTCGLPQLRPVRQYRPIARWDKHVLPDRCLRLGPDRGRRRWQSTCELWPQPEKGCVRAPRRHPGAPGRSGPSPALRDAAVEPRRPLRLDARN